MFLYPNPTDGLFSIMLTEAILFYENKFAIVTLDGKSIYGGSLSPDEYTMHFDFSYIQPGSYVFMIYNNEKILTKEFIKY